MVCFRGLYDDVVRMLWFPVMVYMLTVCMERMLWFSVMVYMLTVCM